MVQGEAQGERDPLTPCCNEFIHERTNPMSAAAFRNCYETTNGDADMPGCLAVYGAMRSMPRTGLAPVGDGVLRGYAKSFNTIDRRSYGTQTTPGRLLGLRPDPAGIIAVRLFQIDPACRDDVLAHLWRRKLERRPYRPLELSVDASGGSVRAMVLVPAPGPDVTVEPLHRTAFAIATAVGRCGANRACFERANAIDAARPEFRSAELLALSALFRAACKGGS